jgi:hypothetical protein
MGAIHTFKSMLMWDRQEYPISLSLKKGVGAGLVGGLKGDGSLTTEI